MKKRFASQYTTNTKDFYLYIFVKSYETENQLGKDICSFNNSELDSLIKSYNNESVHSVYTIVSVLRKYIEFCDKEGYVTTNMNYLNSVGGYKDMFQYVSITANKHKYISQHDLTELIALCINAQDAVIFALLFNGVKGEACEEIVNLKLIDCNFKKNELTLTKNDGTTRKIIVSNQTMTLIKDANKETEYMKNNGEVAGLGLKTNIYKIIPNEYILRISARADNGAIKPFNIISRLNRVKECYGNPYLTVTNIWMSGMINKAIQIVETKLGEATLQTIKTLTKADYVKINIDFGYSEVYWYKTRQLVETYVKLRNNV